MVKGLVIPVDVGQPIEVREFNRTEDFKQAVDGCPEQVHIGPLGITLYLNDEGLLRLLPFNLRASTMWWLHVPTSSQRALLVGTAVVVGLPDPGGDATSVPPDTFELLTADALFGVLFRMNLNAAWQAHGALFDGYFDAAAAAYLCLSGITDLRIVTESQLHEFNRQLDAGGNPTPESIE